MQNLRQYQTFVLDFKTYEHTKTEGCLSITAKVPHK